MVRVVERSDSGVGAALLRREDFRHLRGRGQFVADLKFPRTHEVAFVRSTEAHARLRSVRIPPEAAGRVFVAADFPELKPIASICDIKGWKHSTCSALVHDTVRYVGQPIAICFAPTRDEAEDLAQLVEVEYDVLPAVTDKQQRSEERRVREKGDRTG